MQHFKLAGSPFRHSEEAWILWVESISESSPPPDENHNDEKIPDHPFNFRSLSVSLPAGIVPGDRTGYYYLPSSAGGSATQFIKIEVVEEDIFRVSAIPGKEFPQRTSLSVLPRTGGTFSFTVTQSSGAVEISTSSITARVSLSDGQVTFSDSNGIVLLQEIAGGGKSFVPIKVEDRTGYSFRQVFEWPEEEAFFGLGQHQSDEWNYKGKNEVLYQYNTKIYPLCGFK